MSKRQLLEQFINSNLNNLYRFAYSYTKNHAAAEDMVSESILKALKNIHTLKDPRALRPWMYRITANTCLSYLKKEQKIERVQFDTTCYREGINDDYSDLSFEEIIQDLDPKYKSILILRFFEDLTLEEIAEVLGENQNTVKTRLYRALKLLKVEMEVV